MATDAVTRREVLRKLDQLPPEDLVELALFIDFLVFKEQRQPRPDGPLPAVEDSDAETLLPGSLTARFQGFVRSPIPVAELLEDYELALMEDTEP
jgi:hypothetical protein